MISREEKAREIPLGRQGTINEIAAAIDFIASDASSFINGVELLVDGGSAPAGATAASSNVDMLACKFTGGNYAIRLAMQQAGGRHPPALRLQAASVAA